jgi:hypothetical protein
MIAPRTKLLVCMTILASACGPADDLGTNSGENSAAVSNVYGIDYAWTHPAISTIVGDGYQFVARYYSYDPTKDLSQSEAQALVAAGLKIVGNWEDGATNALNGYGQGASDANSALSEANAVGQPSDRPIYFSVDFDASAYGCGAIEPYFQGVNSVLGLGRTGAYGGDYALNCLFNAGLITFGWQTYAWSYGAWDGRAQFRQIQNSIMGGIADLDQAVSSDFGQWPMSFKTCSLGGHAYDENTCTETLQCNDGNWVARSADPWSCLPGIEPGGACLTDSGALASMNTCTSTLQCDNGVWVDRNTDPTACNSAPPTSSGCPLGGKSYATNTCTETLQCNGTSWEARSSDPSSCLTGIEPGGACLTDSGAVASMNTCTSTLQCDNGVWVDRNTDPSACNSAPPTSSGCALGGKSYATNTCTETLQCNGTSWEARSSDPSSCLTGIEPGGACLTDSGAVTSMNTCTSTLQCDNGVWVDRNTDPSACNCALAGGSYATNTCTETLQCDDGSWVARSADPSSCDSGIEANGACLTDSGAVVPQNTCTSTLQCDDGVWVDRQNDPAACL